MAQFNPTCIMIQHGGPTSMTSFAYPNSAVATAAAHYFASTTALYADTMAVIAAVDTAVADNSATGTVVGTAFAT